MRETLNLMHKLFKLRSCEDSVFRNRSRPCLQYQIGRCSAPCVELVPAADYAESVRRAAMFLEGKSDELTRELGEQMQAASEALEFEQAARLRDLITSLRSMQTRQYVDGRAADLDVLAVAMQGSQACVMLLAFRDGRNLGTRPFFPVPTVRKVRTKCWRPLFRSTTSNSSRRARSCSTVKFLMPT